MNANASSVIAWRIRARRRRLVRAWHEARPDTQRQRFGERLEAIHPALTKLLDALRIRPATKAQPSKGVHRQRTSRRCQPNTSRRHQPAPPQRPWAATGPGW